MFEQNRVIDIQQGSKNLIKTNHGEVEADYLVIYANAYVAGLDKQLEGQVLPAGSYVIATEVLSDKLCKKILPQDMAVCDQRVDLNYYRLSSDNRLRLGRHDGYWCQPPSTNWSLKR